MTESAIKQDVEATGIIEKRQKLTTRMRNYSNQLAADIAEKQKAKDSEDEVYKLSFIRRAILFAFQKVIQCGAWLLDRIEELANWVSDLLSVGGRPITGTYEKVKGWYKGVDPEAAEAELQAA